MSTRIIGVSEYMAAISPQIQIPIAPSGKICKPKNFFLEKLNAPGPPADGISISIVKTSQNNYNLRFSRYYNNTRVIKSFVILKDVLLNQFLDGANTGLRFLVYPATLPSLLVYSLQGRNPCAGEGGDGSEGVKVKIPT